MATKKMIKQAPDERSPMVRSMDSLNSAIADNYQLVLSLANKLLPLMIAGIDCSEEPIGDDFRDERSPVTASLYTAAERLNNQNALIRELLNQVEI